LASTLIKRNGKSYRQSESIAYVSCLMAENNNIMSNILAVIILNNRQGEHGDSHLSCDNK
jgi:hypothetical protein